MNSKSNAQAMETEKIPRLLAQLAIPAVVAQIINLLYNIVDRIYIGHIPGVEVHRVQRFLWERKIIRQLKRFLETVLQFSCLWPQL